MFCKHLGQNHLVRVKCADGHWQARKLCHDCRRLMPNPVNQRLIEMDALDEFVVGYKNPDCVVCHHPDTQLHHFMPQALARKNHISPDDWPTAYLCSRCHDLWHKIVTPGLVGKITNGRPRSWEAPKP